MTASLHDQIALIQNLITHKLGISGRSFEAQLRKARRFLPRYLRRELIYLAQAQALVDNPKLQRMIDRPRLEAACRDAIAYLEKVDVSGRRRAMAAQMAASIGFGLLVTLILLLVVLVQRDLI
jgi:hypothetical protein